ncbi:hypothetical protein DWF00_24445 [Bosea caraganae]|uniref:OmpA-like domain-containing protein n=1 Tax=Bosea caraganae TaxID=2763117 RepID=A0A370L4M6_9HYPH|nr:OmpA family protein [Bosea caraganae]RDJ22360.1 hypothetical protein DWF00_24445 [Bosea caraganae]RDJ23706.1 hypothetical protein DWE98_16310 [Bosea caraganae]
MFDDTQVRSKVLQIVLYSAVLVAGLVALAFLLPWIFSLFEAPPKPLPAPAVRIETPAPPPKIGQLERIRSALAPEISAGSITVDPFGGWIAIRVGNLITFDSGQANVLSGFVPVGRRIAEIVEKEKGPVRIVGHTDNQALAGGGAFKDNDALSVARAKAVAGLLQGAMTDGSRVTTEGRGSNEPIGDNATAEGRAKNRRVEILITRAD